MAQVRACCCTARAGVAAVVGSLAIAACGRGAAPSVAVPDGDCIVVPARGTAPAVTLGLVGEVDPAHAPVAATEAERLLFRQQYESLVRRDCAGRLHPALAASWRTVDGGRRWRLTLAREARFWNGQPVRAEDVVAAWGRHGAPGAAVSAVDDSTVAVTFAEQLEQPWPLADPAFSIAAPADGGAWPFGTTRPGRVRHVEAADARDLLDRAVDVVVTREPAVVTYARGLGRYDEVPLPWDRAYVLMNGDPLLPDDDRLTEGFVAAVAAFARPPDGRGWWDGLTACGYLQPAGWGAPAVVRFAAADPVARDLAARLVAVSRRSGLRAAPGDGSPRDGAVVRWLPRTPFRPCEVAREVGLAAGSPTVRPLLETRAVLLVRRAAGPGVVVDWDGMPRLLDASR